MADIGPAAGNRPAWVHFDLLWHPQRASAPYVPAYTPSLAGRERFLQPDALAVFGVDLPVLAPPPVDALIRSEMPE